MSQVDYSKYIRREEGSPKATSEYAGSARRNASADVQDDVAMRPDMVPDEQNPEQMRPRDGGLVDVVKSLFGGDRVLWIIIITMMVVSVLVVYSSTAKMAYMPSSATSPAEFLRAQLSLLALCVVVLFISHRINSNFYRRWSYLFFYSSVILTIAAYVAGNASINGAARWINIAGFQFQPSEALKITIVMYLARVLADRQNTIATMQIAPSLKFWTWRSSAKQRRIWREGGLPIFLPIVLSCAVILPAHTSSAVLVFCISMAMLFIGRVSRREIMRIVLWAFMGAAMVGIMGLGRSHTAGGRISTWVEVWRDDRTKIDVQDLSDTERSMIAIHNGGVMGRGAGQSAARVEMTHPESDYAFAFFAEEYGIVIAILLVALYVWIFYRAIEIFRFCPKKFPTILSLGLAMLITGQALLHTMVTVNILPETGQPLPMISRGGSSLLFTSLALGIILSVSRQNLEGAYLREDE